MCMSHFQGRHATLLFNNVSRLGTGALRDDPKNGCKGDNILTVVFFNIEDITWSHGDTNFVQRELKNIPRMSAANQWILVPFQFQSISSHFCASSSVSLNVGYNTAVINQNVIYLFRTKQVLGMPFYSGLAVHIAQGYQSTSMLSLMPTATRGGTRGII